MRFCFCSGSSKRKYLKMLMNLEHETPYFVILSNFNNIQCILFPPIVIRNCWCGQNGYVNETKKNCMGSVLPFWFSYSEMPYNVLYIKSMMFEYNETRMKCAHRSNTGFTGSSFSFVEPLRCTHILPILLVPVQFPFLFYSLCTLFAIGEIAWNVQSSF